MNRVTLYTKPGCHLCEAVKQVIDRVREREPFEIELRNIETDAKDRARYWDAVPVVAVNGREIARYRLDERALEAALQSAEAGV